MAETGRSLELASQPDYGEPLASERPYVKHGGQHLRDTPELSNELYMHAHTCVHYMPRGEHMRTYICAHRKAYTQKPTHVYTHIHDTHTRPPHK